MKAKKSLGQNFLIDNNIKKKIGASIPAKKNDLIIEIGPGQGALTKELKMKNCQIICYEIDEDMRPILAPLENDLVKVNYIDILEAKIKKDIENIEYNNLYVVGNLPYYITTKIIKKLINEDLNAEQMIFMVQEEVADRFTALPNTKDYGSITLYFKYFFNLEKLFRVSKHCFNPVPKVESAIIAFRKRVDILDVDKDKYFKLITDSFKMKRKTLKNNLSNYDFSKILPILNKYGLTERVRAEEIPEEVFAEISKVI